MLIFILNYTIGISCTTIVGKNYFTLPLASCEYILLGSEKIYINKKKIEKNEYLIDYETGIIELNFLPTPSDTIHFECKKITTNIKKEQFIWEEKNEVKQNTNIIKEEKKENKNKYENDENEIELTGMKAFSFSFGTNSSPTLSQSMNLTLSGEAANSIKFTGNIVDNDLPLNTTTKIKEIEQMNIKVEKNSSKITLGDINLKFNSNFGEIQRKLVGMVYEDNNLLLSGAMTKGNYQKKLLKGIFGKQGPYELSFYGIEVNSEKIYVNGKLLKRDIDYIINYEEGNIIFTYKFPVQEDMNIIAFFHEKNEEYKTIVYASQVKYNGLKSTIIREEDKFNLPQRIISSDSEYVYIDGGRYVGYGKGSYIKKDTIYEYVGYGKGDYEVYFSRKPGGEYIFDPILCGYKYVGYGNGEYTSKNKIRAPQKNEIIMVEYEKENNIMKFNSSFCGSRYTQNNSNLTPILGGAILSEIGIKKSIFNIGGKIKRENNFNFTENKDTLQPEYYEGKIGANLTKNLFTESKIIKNGNENIKQILAEFSRNSMPTVGYKYTIGKEIEKELYTSYLISGFTPYFVWRKIGKKEIGVKNEKMNFSFSKQTGLFLINFELLSENGNLSYTLQKKDNKFIDIGNANLKLKYYSLNYNLTSVEEKFYKEEYYKVEKGEGSFNKDTLTGEYYPTENGEYEKRIIPCDSIIICSKFDLENKVRIPLAKEIYFDIITKNKGNGRLNFFNLLNNNSLQREDKFAIYTKLYDISTTYSKGNRKNKIYLNTASFEELFDVKYIVKDLELNYITRNNLNQSGKIITKEKATTYRIANDINSLSINFGIECRKISRLPYEPYSFYGINFSHTFNFNIHKKNISIYNEIIKWNNEDAPAYIKFMYPPGINFNSKINLNITKNNNIITLSYEISKIQEYKLQQIFNAQLNLLF